MLFAAIVYIQGSGGNLLERTLTLSEETIPRVPVHLAEKQALIEMPESSRIKLFNNWDSSNWIKSESEINFWFEHSLVPFIDYENSNSKFIYSMHPGQFVDGFKTGIWTEQNSFKHIIFIDYNEFSFNDIVNLAIKKRPDCSHKYQIYNTELELYVRLREQYKPACIVQWEDFLNIKSYCNLVEHLANEMSLTINMDYVKILWTNWYNETQKILKETK